MSNTTSGPMSSGKEQQGKDTTFSAQQQTLLGLLKSGRRFSAKMLSKLTPDRDPRSTIRHLRRKGAQVGDQWVSDGGPRYKLYFMVPGESIMSNPQLSLFEK